jgi:hypothetical protein
MADKRLERRQILDPAVADLLSGLEDRQQEARLPRREREKKARERAKIKARREQRTTYDLPPAIRQRIKEMGEEHRLPASQLVTLALFRFLQAVGAGQVDPGMFKQPSHSPRYDWNLVFPEEWYKNI